MNTATPSLHRVALKQHYGWEIYEMMAVSLAAAAYLAVRQSHTFLTNDNHTHAEGPRSLNWGGEQLNYFSVDIKKNTTSPRFKLAPAWIPDGPGETWLGVEYREAAPGEENPAWINSLNRRKAERAKLAA